MRVVSAGVLALGESIDPVAMLAVHALSLPYLDACAAIGVAALCLIAVVALAIAVVRFRRVDAP